MLSRIGDELVSGASERVAAAGGVGDAQLLVAFASYSYERARPAESVTNLKATLGDFCLERATEDSGNGGPYSERVELSRRRAGISEMRNRGAYLRGSELVLGAMTWMYIPETKGQALR